MSDTTAAGLTDLRELVHAATGPWTYLSTTGEVECTYANSTHNSTLTIESSDGESAGTIASGVVATVNLLPALLDRLAAVQAERDRANAGWRQAWGYVCEIARALGVNPDDGHPMDATDRLIARADAAEAERDAARAELEALRERVGALVKDGERTTYSPHTVYTSDLRAALEADR